MNAGGRVAAALMLVLLISACSSRPHPIRMKIEGAEEIYTGVMNIGANIQDVHLESVNGSTSCEGVSLLGYGAPGCASNGSLRLECTDGREINADWHMTECDRGGGEGHDERNNPVTFLIGEAISERTDIQARRIVAAPANANSRSYLFRFGGNLAAGFGDAAASGYHAIFEDADSGLFIVTVQGDATPMSLATEPPQAGQEAFLVMPSEMDDANVRIVGARLERGASEMLRIGNVSRTSSGLPVIDLDGKVIGLTLQSEEGAYLFGAERLRRYLQIVAPELADAPASGIAAPMLRERIQDLQQERAETH